MKSLLRIQLLLALLFLSVSAAKAQEANDLPLAEVLIEQYYEAIGGKATWDTLNTIVLHEKQLFSGTEIPVTIYRKKADLYKLVIDFQGNITIQAYDGNTAWGIHPNSQTAKKADEREQATILRQAPFYNKLMVWQDSSYTVKNNGLQNVNDDKTAYEIEVAKNNDVHYYYIDPNTFLLVKEKYPAEIRGMGETWVEVFYSDFQEVGNIVHYNYIKIKTAGVTTARWRIEKIDLNPHIENSIFEFPSEDQ